MNVDALKKIVPIVLTHNEEINIARTLDSLSWANKVTIVDSGSTDHTQTIASNYPNVEWLSNPFDDFRSQWEFGVAKQSTDTKYILGLDADMEVPSALLEEISTKFLGGGFDGGMLPFDYRYYGISLAGSLYPPQLRLFRRDSVKITQFDHGQKFVVAGKIYHFHNRLIHDDRKPIERWLVSQLKYQEQNERGLWMSGRRRPRDYFRKVGLMPPLMGLLAYFKAGGPFKGAAAARYAYERMVAEGVLAIRLLDQRLQRASRNGRVQVSDRNRGSSEGPPS
jgi:glycosyltransferase involved in cell wall biosynthesis